MTKDSIRAAWERFHGPIDELDGYIPATPPTYSQGYRDGYEAGKSESSARALVGAVAIVDSLENQIAMLRLELRDALSIGYGASMNWPASARELLGMDT
jgi:hypothetical protein